MGYEVHHYAIFFTTHLTPLSRSKYLQHSVLRNPQDNSTGTTLTLTLPLPLQYSWQNYSFDCYHTPLAKL